MTATSSSDRHTAAREALNYYSTADANTISSRDTDTGENYSVLTAAAGMAAALRALVEPPATLETPEAIASAIYLCWVNNDDDRRTEREVLTHAVRAGIQAAWESWEPEL